MSICPPRHRAHRSPAERVPLALAVDAAAERAPVRHVLGVLLLAEVASARRVDEAAHRTPASAVDEAAALHSAPAFVSELPDDVLRVIWAIRWRADAAAKIQRAVRRAIRRAGGDPWGLPDLMNFNFPCVGCFAVTDHRHTFAKWGCRLAHMPSGHVISFGSDYLESLPEID